MNVYKGSFNWHGQVFTMHTSALSKTQARNNCIKRIAGEVDKPVGIVKLYFNNGPDNWKVVEV